MINNFEFYLKKYEQAINKYARDLSNEIGKFDELEDYKQVGAEALFELYKKREELINFEPEIYQYKDILIKAKKKGLIIDFNIGVRNPYKYMSDFLTLATKWVRSVLKNDMRDHRRQSLSYDQKTILSNYIDHTPNTNLKPNNIRYRTFKALNLYNFNILRITKENIINRVDILNILKEIKNPNLKKIFIFWCNFYNAYEIAKMIGISNQAVYKNIDQIKKILNLYFKEVN
ncbi:hypothetical protein ES703_78275 [subsurface metagenome]